MSFGEGEVADAGSQVSTRRLKVGGRRAWLGFAVMAVVVGGAIGAAEPGDQSPGARSAFLAVEALSAAAKNTMHTMHPPVGDLVVMSYPIQPGPEAWRQFTSVVWYATDGQVCGVFVRNPVWNDSFCANVNVDGVQLADRADLFRIIMSSDGRFLWVLGSVPPEVTSVTAVNGAGLSATAKVVTVPLGADRPFHLFAVSLYSADLLLGPVRFDGADASGRVILTESTVT